MAVLLVMVGLNNHPLNLIVHQVGPAVATGCPVIIKPAEDTPLSCFRFINILREAGLPEEWCQSLIVKNLENATKLVTDSRVAFFSFIGSARVGWSLRSQVAPGTRCALEHGGAAPVVVAADADLERLVPSLTKGGFYHAGQVCVSVQRVFADGSIAREVAQKIVWQSCRDTDKESEEKFTVLSNQIEDSLPSEWQRFGDEKLEIFKLVVFLIMKREDINIKNITNKYEVG